MKRRVFVDSDIILDVLANREPFNASAKILFAKLQKGDIEGFTSPLIFANLFYILRKEHGQAFAKGHLKKLRSFLNVLPMDEKAVDFALDSNLPDFEDALQIQCAAKSGIETILTRNTADYKGARCDLFTVEEFLNSLP